MLSVSIIMQSWQRRPSNTAIAIAFRQRTLTMRPGLFDVRGLDSPASLRALAQNAITQCRSLIKLLPMMQHSVESLRLLDQISDQCCRIIDLAELIRHIHPQEKWRRESQLAYDQMFGFIAELNLHPTVFNSLDGIRQNFFSYLTSEQRQMVSTLLMDMKHNGIELRPTQRVQITELLSEISKLETQFYSNLLNPSFEQPVRVDKHYLPPFILNYLPQTNGEFVDHSPGNSKILLANCTDSATRKAIFIQTNSQAKENLSVLHSLVQHRKEYSNLLGYPSFVDLRLSTMMLRSSSEVANFLHEISSRLRVKAKAEINLLRSVSCTSTATLDAWDIPFYCNRIRQSNGLSFAQLHYFSLDKLLAGFNVIVRNLFGVNMQRCVLNRTEIESFGETNLQKIAFFDSFSNQIGTLYLDLFSRPQKFSAAAQFTLKNPSPGALPSAAIVCSFDPQHPRLLHSECVALFHELGHVLHLFLSRSAYSHLAGTRGPTDFVEIVSHLLEHFVWDSRVLAILSGLPPSSVETYLHSLAKSKNAFAALDLQAQVAYSMVDQILFGESNMLNQDSTQIWSQVQNTHMSYNYVEGTHPQTTISHLCGYGATYYSYLYARVIASHIWKEYFQKDPLSSNAGRIFRDRFLSPGLGRCPKDSLNNLLDGGSQPTIDTFIQKECF